MGSVRRKLPGVWHAEGQTRGGGGAREGEQARSVYPRRGGGGGGRWPSESSGRTSSFWAWASATSAIAGGRGCTLEEASERAVGKGGSLVCAPGGGAGRHARTPARAAGVAGGSDDPFPFPTSRPQDPSSSHGSWRFVMRALKGMTVPTFIAVRCVPVTTVLAGWADLRTLLTAAGSTLKSWDLGFS